MEKSWDCSNNAGLRPVLFLNTQNITFGSIEKILDKLLAKKLIINKEYIFNKIRESVFSILDEFFAPIIVKHINSVKLKGNSKKEKYKDFFLDENLQWSQNVLNMLQEENQIIKYIVNIVNDKINSFEIFLKNYYNNYQKIQKFFQLKNITIKDIKDGLSDNHNNLGSCICVTFLDNKKLIYKPRNADIDILFNKYISILDLKGVYSIKTVKVLDIDNNSSWHSYERQTRTNDTNKLKKFYINFGVMLAVLDSLNYMDGHSENFIASCNKLILLDAETLFTNYSYYAEKNVPYNKLSFTGMIHDKTSDFIYENALQSKESKAYFPISLHILNDFRSDIKISYRKVAKNTNNKSIPFKNAIKLSKYIDCIVQGAMVGYSSIAKNKDKLIELIQNNQNIKFRQIKRPTLYYTLLIHRALHPLNKDIHKFLSEKLIVYNNDIIQHEINCILTNNIPIFYNRIGNKDLILHDDSVIDKNHFYETPLYWFCKKMNNITNEDFIKKRIEEIKNLT